MRRAATLLALLALLAQTLSSHQPAAAAPDRDRVAVCTAAGIVWLDAHSGAPASPPSDRSDRASHACCLAHHAGCPLPCPLAVGAPGPVHSARSARPRDPATGRSRLRANAPRAPPLSALSRGTVTAG